MVWYGTKLGGRYAARNVLNVPSLSDRKRDMTNTQFGTCGVNTYEPDDPLTSKRPRGGICQRKPEVLCNDGVRRCAKHAAAYNNCFSDTIGTCGHTPEQITAKMDAHDATVREHIRQEETVLTRLAHVGPTDAYRDARDIILRARRSEGR